ncbi:MAG: RNA polymerase sporulation sigma factor SigK [Lachnospira sp.]
MKAFEKPLPLREEKEMIERCQAGDVEACNILIEKNMRLVAHMVKKYASTERDIDDCISVGTIGLIKAVNSFKPNKNIRLATYAAKCIDNELLMMLRNDRKKRLEVSIYETIGTDKEGNEISLIDVIRDTDINNGEKDQEADLVEKIMFDERIKCIMDNIDKVLNDREKKILIERFGLYGKAEKTQMELAKELKISRSYVSRIEGRALNKLKKLLCENHLS